MFRDKMCYPLSKSMFNIFCLIHRILNNVMQIPRADQSIRKSGLLQPSCNTNGMGDIRSFRTFPVLSLVCYCCKLFCLLLQMHSSYPLSVTVSSVLAVIWYL